MWAREMSSETDLSPKFCFSCHTDDKVAAKKQLGQFSHPVDVSITKVEGKTILPTFSKEGKKQEEGQKRKKERGLKEDRK